MLKFRLISAKLWIVMGALVLSACGGTAATEIPTMTVNPDDIRTQAVSTFAADLTLTAFAAPTNTPAATMTPLATFTPLTPIATVGGGLGVGSTAPAGTGACYGLTYVSDVTITDNTPVTAGQTFTKTWKVKNSGTCAWEAGSKFSFVSGDAMGGTAYTLPSSVAAGAIVDISVPMTAPTNKTGTIRGDWQLFRPNGQAIPGGVYVQVVIGGASAPTNTGAAPVATTAVATTAVPAATTETVATP